MSTELSDILEIFNRLLNARDDYIDAKRNVPEYTADKPSSWYYRNELVEYEETMQKFIDALSNLIGDTSDASNI